MMSLARLILVTTVLLSLGHAAGAELRGTGNLGLVVERASGSVEIVDTGKRRVIGRVEGLGDLSHASAVFSRTSATPSCSAATVG